MITLNEKLKSKRIIAVVNQKGGVGKTTTAVNLATALAAVNKKILIVDIDPQGNATTSVGVTRNDKLPSSYQVIIGQHTLSDAILWTKIPNLSLVPASRDLLGLDMELSQQEGHQFFLKKALNTGGFDYDYIIIDCPPSVGLLTVNALVAADAVIAPVQCEYLALEGIADLMKTIERVKRHLNPKLEIQGIVMTMYDGRNRLADLVVENVRTHFDDKLYHTLIPRNIRISEAPSHGKPILLYDWKSTGAQAYIELAREFIKREDSLKRATHQQAL